MKAGIYKFDVEKPESDFSNQKVKEKNIECSSTP
jgi:hypothetical protein